VGAKETLPRSSPVVIFRRDNEFQLLEISPLSPGGKKMKDGLDECVRVRAKEVKERENKNYFLKEMAGVKVEAKKSSPRAEKDGLTSAVGGGGLYRLVSQSLVAVAERLIHCLFYRGNAVPTVPLETQSLNSPQILHHFTTPFEIGWFTNH
jgi:hypothetical protein